MGGNGDFPFPLDEPTDLSRARAEHEAKFEAAYGPRGEWAMLFGASPAYQGTELLSDASTRGRYMTIDRWSSAESFDAFRRLHAAEYDALDARCEAWASAETKIGTWVTL
jgi:heme-degrading monooxygenase HmoA